MTNWKRTLSALVAGGACVLAASTPLAVAGQPAGAPFGSRPAALATPSMDFDGDGIDDLVAYAWWPSGRGCLHIEYSSGIPVVCPEPYPDEGGEPDNAYWGSGDFDGDGYDDLVLGEEDRTASGDGRDYAGRVEVYYGSVDGISSRYQLFTLDTPGIAGTAEPYEEFGKSLDAGDVNGDGYDDLVIGVPADHVHDVRAAGSVVLLYGSTTGLQGEGSLRFTQNHVGVPGRVEKYGAFGAAVAIEDVTGDGLGDVAVSSLGPADELVSVLPGSRSGLRFTGATWVNLAREEVTAVDLMVGGDFNGDGYGDLAAGAPRNYPGGKVAEILGSRAGISSTRFHVFKQGSGGIPGNNEYGDFWSSSLVAGDLTGDGRDDLLVGNPAEKVGRAKWAGNITLILGGRQGLGGEGATLWNQGGPMVCGRAVADNDFGKAMTIGHFSDSQGLDARVSAPDDDTGGDGAGLLVTVRRGAAPHPDGCTVGIRYELLGFDLIGATD